MSNDVRDKGSVVPLMEAATERLGASKRPFVELMDTDPFITLPHERLAEAPAESDATRCILPGGVARGNPATPRLAGYEILEELGRGGMGVVYKAWQHSLRRTVALKMILAGSFAANEELVRFRGEAMAVARLHHPHLLSIYEIGENQHLPFYAMEYMEGGSLARRLNGQPIDPRVAANLLRALAEAMDYAHKNGIVHRDLKPANILLSGRADTPIDASIAKIADFGIAKYLHEDTNYTRTGDILGTPHYMAPEQATGGSANVGPTADVYSLGAILYELLTGRAPFHGYEGAAVLIRMTREEPERPSYFVRGLPRDLQTICLKCLEKNPTQRYASAAALADDLGRFLQNEPIQAKPSSLADRAFKWARRRPAWAAIVGMTMALALVGVGMMAMMWRQAVQHAQKQDELINGWKALLADDYLERGIHLAEKGDVRRGMHLMVRALEVAEEIERTEKQPNLLAPVIRMNLAAWSQCVGAHEMKLPHNDWVWDVAFSADRKFVLTASRDKTVKIWDTETAQQIGVPLEHPLPIWSLAIHPDGKTLFTLCSDDDEKRGELRAWSADAEQPGRFTLRGEPMKFAGDAFHLQINAAGDRLWISTYSSANASLVEFDRAGAGNGLRLLASLDGAHTGGTFSPDGATLATLVGTGLAPTKQVQLWNGRTGAKMGEPLEHPGAARTLAFSKTGQHLIVGAATDVKLDQGETSRLHVWDWAQRKSVAQSQPLFGRLRTMAIAPGGQMFAVSLFQYLPGKDPARPFIYDGHIALWQLHADGQIDSYGQPLRTENAVWSMEFSPDSRLLLAGARNSGAFLWSVSNCQRVRTPIWHEGNCVKVAFRADGRQACTASAGGNNSAAARLWEVPTFAHIGLPMPQPRDIRGAFWEHGGKHAWFCCGDFLCQSDPFSGLQTEKARLPRFAYYAHPGRTEGHALLDFGKGDGLNEFERGSSDCPRLAELPTEPQGGPQNVFQKNGQRILQCFNQPCRIRILDDTGKVLTPMITETESHFHTAEFSRKGDLVAIAQGLPKTSSYRLRIYETKSLTLLREVPLKYSVASLSFSPDGSTVALGGADRQVQRIDVHTGAFKGPPLLLESVVRSVRYVRDERLLVTEGEKGRVLLWDAPTGKRVGPAFEHHTDLVCVEAQPTGEYLLTATTGRMAMTWRFPEPATGSLEHLRLWVETLTGMEMKEHDTMVLLDMDRLRGKRRDLIDNGGVPVPAR